MAELGLYEPVQHGLPFSRISTSILFSKRLGVLLLCSHAPLLPILVFNACVDILLANSYLFFRFTKIASPLDCHASLGITYHPMTSSSRFLKRLSFMPWSLLR
ncbi:hypothetical protein GALMADRAFT_872984 [Galerina marginata CBS 339.88]|uniref:Uncharacterized protein n=1 Tax=Galerina marginata (strain CBS 339.88) TaxID=685588 RepID=A0A067TVY4_GALM3|nr:hypothetical protein GALMADRAFT_872984 [Galerina marginata CBS 339.88]